MSVTFTNWQDGRQPGKPYDKCSPNLIAVVDETGKRFGGYNLGCYGVRRIRGGTAWSTHAFGAAVDWRLDDDTMRGKAISYLTHNFEVLGVQAVHDYVGCRIWHAWRTPNVSDIASKWWKNQTPNAQTGMGQPWAKWLHIETDESNWYNNIPIPNRFIKPTSRESMIINFNVERLPDGTINPAWAAAVSTGPHTGWLRNGTTYSVMVQAGVPVVTLGTAREQTDYLHGTITTSEAPPNLSSEVRSLWEQRRQ